MTPYRQHALAPRFQMGLIVAVLFSLNGWAHAHGGFHEQILALDEQLEAHPNDPALYMARAEAQLSHGDWQACLVELDRADRLTSSSEASNLLRGRALALGGQWSAADTALTSYLAGHPDNPDALLERARVRQTLHQNASALADYRDALNATQQTEVDLYFELAAALDLLNKTKEAIQVLQQGLASKPNNPQLLLRALDYELKLGHFDAALQLATTLQSSQSEPAPWMAKRASVLAQAGRTAKSAQAWSKLRAHITARPETERNSHAMSLLLEQAQNALAALQSPPLIQRAVATASVIITEPTPSAASDSTLFTTDAGSGTLTRAAYLQQAGPTTMTIRWRSSLSVAGRVQYGATPASLTSTVDESSAKTDHEVTLTGLTPNTVYYYSIGSAMDTLAGGDTAHTFTTPPVPGSSPNTRIWVLGDAGTGTSNQTSVRDAFYTWTGARDPNLVLQLGDNAYNSGTDSEFQAKVFNIYGSLMKRVPFWSCLGNHETAQATAFVDTYPYFSIYTFPKAAECGGLVSGSEHYYSFDYGNIHFISLDSMTASRSASGAMATWVAADLAATTRTWIICFFHHPPYTKGSHNSDTETELIEMRGNILPILEAGGVDLVLSGHSHCYERSYLLDGHYGLSGTLTAAMKKNGGNGRPAGNGAYIKPLSGPRDHFGTVYTLAGSSGQISGGSLNHPAHYISLNNLGSLVLDVNGTQLDATFLRETGAADDSFTIIKQGAADSDNDGIADAYEIAHGMNRFDPADATLDTDHDGLDARTEYLLGLNTAAPDRYPWTTSAPDANTHAVTVSFPTFTDRKYQVLWSNDLLSWQTGSSWITGDNTTHSWTDDGSNTGSLPGNAVEKRRFYRVSATNAP